MAKNIVNTRPIGYLSVTIEGGTYNIKSIGNFIIIEFTESSVIYNMASIGSLSNGYIYNLKNISGGGITIELKGGENIEGDAFVTLLDGENLQLYIENTTTFRTL